MAFVPDHQYDVFVSYAHVDNMPFPGADKGWVTMLVETLEILLAQKLGRREGFSLWMDRELSRHKQLTPEILNSLSNTATLVVILSPGYLASEWCLKEKDTFHSLREASRDSGSRVFVVERDKVEFEDRPTEFSDLLGYRFWVPGEGDGTPMILGMPFPDPRNPRQMPYFDELTRLACNLADELKQLRATVGEPPAESVLPTNGASTPGAEPVAATAQPAEDRPAVLLAEVTDDLDPRGNALRTYVEQAGYRVLPESWYPRDAEGFRAALDADLARSAVFVQLLSSLPGKRPPDLPEGYVRAQYDRAAAAGLPIVQWRSPELSPGSIEDEGHRALLELDTVMAVSTDELHREVMRHLTAEKSEEPVEMADGLIFVNAEVGDMELAQRLCEQLEARGLSCALPLAGGTPAQVREDLEQNLIYCDGALIVYGEAPSRWVRDQLLLLRKVAWKRESPLKALAVFEAPVPEQEAIHYIYPGLIKIEGQADAETEALAPFLAALGGQS